MKLNRFGTFKSVKLLCTVLTGSVLMVTSGCSDKLGSSVTSSGFLASTTSPSLSPTPTATPTPTPKPTATPTPTPKPTATPTPTPKPTATPTPTPKPTPTPTPTPKPTATPTPTPPTTSGISVRQVAVANTGVGFGSHPSYLSATFAKPTLKGSAIWVVVSSPDHDVPAYFVYSVTDPTGNTYKQVGDNANVDNPGNQSVAQFAALNTNSISNTQAVTFTMSYTYKGVTSAGADNYLGIFIVEVAGATSYAGSSHVDQPDYTTANKGTGLISSGAISAPNGPEFVLAFSMNCDGGSSDEGGSGYGGPAVGTGLTEYGSMLWAMDTKTALSTFATGMLTAAGGTVEAYFNAPPNSTVASNPNQYATVAIVFR